ncbi:MAG: DEAD/DEAH box helicase family protein, partial [Candidatus Latescibacteria bacterium]|nr:DEAD/DEAH box helicase family protein [Candidatus Latescibacterota bacterium]
MTLGSLQDLNLEPVYESGYQNLVTDFYVPCLKCAVLYERSAGYFTSSGLSAAAKGIAHLLNNDGEIRLIASPKLNENDIAAMREGSRDRQEVIEDAVRTSFRDAENKLVNNRLSALSWLISTGKLKVKLALLTGPDGATSGGFYHKKTGIITDSNGDYVAFTGSGNETVGGLISNHESICVFDCWETNKHAQQVRDYFKNEWNSPHPHPTLEIIDFTDATDEILEPYKGNNPPRIDPEELETQATPVVKINKWRHQDDAVTEFLRHKRGILEMATGTGKTRTALRIARSLLNDNVIDTIIIAADGTDLLDQWHGQVLSLLKEQSKPWALHRHYDTHHEREFFDAAPTAAVLLCSRQALPPALSQLNDSNAKRCLLIHDEVHRLGSPSNRRDLAELTDSITYRLGLSATPDREYDSEGNEFIQEHLGPVLFEFTLEDAIRRGILAPFDYHPITYTPSEEDREATKNVYKIKAAREAAGNPMTKEELWIALARVYKVSRTKLPLFRTFLKTHPSLLDRCIIFVEEMEYGESVLEIVHTVHHDFHTYYGGEDQEVLRRFA